MSTQTKRRKCRRSFCPNYYDDVIGSPGSWGKGAKAECIPCLFACQMVDQGQTIEQIEAVPDLMSQFATLLESTGWTWEDVKQSFGRLSSLVPADRETEILM